jgi:hypothetical protein
VILEALIINLLKDFSALCLVVCEIDGLQLITIIELLKWQDQALIPNPKDILISLWLPVQLFNLCPIKTCFRPLRNRFTMLSELVDVLLRHRDFSTSYIFLIVEGHLILMVFNGLVPRLYPV